jgi:hypothetical protein
LKFEGITGGSLGGGMYATELPPEVVVDVVDVVVVVVLVVVVVVVVVLELEDEEEEVAWISEKYTAFVGMSLLFGSPPTQ